MSRDPRDWRADMVFCQSHQEEEEYEYWTTTLEYWLQQAKTLKEDNARWTCKHTAAEQKYLDQSNVIAELRGREQKLKEAVELIETMSEVTGDQNIWKFARHTLSTLYPLDREDTNE